MSCKGSRWVSHAFFMSTGNVHPKVVVFRNLGKVHCTAMVWGTKTGHRKLHGSHSVLKTGKSLEFKNIFQEGKSLEFYKS